MRTFVMGDIHGNYTALKQCLERSGFNKEKDRLIQLGDVIDRKPDAYECVEELLSVKNCIAIRGNHDDWFREFIETGYHPVSWDHGGYYTAASYLSNNGKGKKILYKHKNGLDPKDIPETHRNFFIKQLPYYLDEYNNCFVHAGFDRFNCFEGQRPENYYWNRELWLDALGHFGQEVLGNTPSPFYMKTTFNSIFIGHTPTLQYNQGVPMKALNIYNLDTGAGTKGKLTIMNVATQEFFQSDGHA